MTSNTPSGINSHMCLAWTYLIEFWATMWGKISCRSLFGEFVKWLTCPMTQVNRNLSSLLERITAPYQRDTDHSSIFKKLTWMNENFNAFAGAILKKKQINVFRVIIIREGLKNLIKLDVLVILTLMILVFKIQKRKKLKINLKLQCFSFNRLACVINDALYKFRISVCYTDTPTALCWSNYQDFSNILKSTERTN